MLYLVNIFQVNHTVQYCLFNYKKGVRMKKIATIIFLAYSVTVMASVPVTSTTDSALTYQMSDVHLDAMQNLQSLIQAVNKAQDVNGQVTALQNLKDFTKDPQGATDQVNNTVKNMLDDFNMRSGTNFGNLQDLISGLNSSTTATGMSLKLQQSTTAQLQSMNVMLRQMEAENQAVLRYKQAEIELDKKRNADLKTYDQKEISNGHKFATSRLN